jgi:glycosyltransferase involved in cell wall biosynthesis
VPAAAPPSLTLVLLAYNEQASLDRVLDEAVGYAGARLADWEIVVVDDGSRDRTPTIAAARSRDEPRIRVVTHPENRGMGAGMASGIAAARMEYLVFLPADGQTPVDAIDRMLPLLDRADVVVTTYDNRRYSPVRVLLSAGLRGYMRVLAGIRFELQGLYLFPVAPAQAIAGDIRAQTFFYSFELIDRGIQRGLTVAATTMRYLPRAAGGSKVANLRRIRAVAGEVARYAVRKRLGR